MNLLKGGWEMISEKLRQSQRKKKYQLEKLLTETS
jgi:hypothetical protein